MPITPLHFGILAPVNHWFPKKVSNVSFVLVNLALDAVAIHDSYYNIPLPDHTVGTHSFVGAWGWAMFLMALGIRLQKQFWPTRAWVLGCFLGATTHILLDMLVHAEMSPFHSLTGNPFYMGWMEPLSMALLPLTVWFLAQSVSGIQARIGKRWADWFGQKP